MKRKCEQSEALSLANVVSPSPPPTPRYNLRRLSSVGNGSGNSTSLALIFPDRILPLEIVLKIFLLLDVEDLFNTCACVCKRWNSFVMSELFVETLLRSELKHAAVNFFLKEPSAISNLKKCLAKNLLFRRRGLLLKGIKSRRISCEPKPGAEKMFSLNSVSLFVQLLTSREDQSWRQLPYCFMEGSDGRRCWMINFRKLVAQSGIVEHLRLPIVIGDDMSFCTHDFFPKVAIYDSDMNLLFRGPSQSVYYSCLTMQNYNPKMCYIAFGPCNTLLLRVMLPSQKMAFHQKLLNAAVYRESNFINSGGNSSTASPAHINQPADGDNEQTQRQNAAAAAANAPDAPAQQPVL